MHHMDTPGKRRRECLLEFTLINQLALQNDPSGAVLYLHIHALHFPWTILLPKLPGPQSLEEFLAHYF